MEFWKAWVLDVSGASVSFVSEKACVREWVAWHLRRGARCGVVSVSGVVSSAAALSSAAVWRPVWQFTRNPSTGVVAWSAR